MRRRDLLLTGAAACLPAPALAATSADRAFRIIRDGSDIGTHTLAAMQTSAGMQIDITIRIAVKVLGITAYRYEMDNREVWKDGVLVSLNSRVNDDGDNAFAKAELRDGGVQIEGSAYTGEAPGDIATTSYFVKDFLDRRPWLSTQTGRLLKVSVAPDGANAYQVDGELTTQLEYDGRGEWVGCQFDAGGEPARYEITAQSGSISALWADA